MPLNPIPILDELAARLAALVDPTELDVYEVLLPYENIQRAAVAATFALNATGGEGGGTSGGLVAFSLDDPLTDPAVGERRVTMTAAGSLVAVVASVGTAPTGAALVIDVNKSDTTVFPTQAHRPSIAIGTKASSIITPDVASFVPGDYFTVDLDEGDVDAAAAVVTLSVQLD